MRTVKKHDIHKVDIIGDVHGCYESLIYLVQSLGYVKDLTDGLFKHPEGRHLAFVGDLTDRGPHNRECLYFALRHVEAGYASYVQGNHCNKLGRFLKGNEVSLTGGLDTTAKELERLAPDAREKLSERVLNLPLVITFDDGKLMMCHAAPPPKGMKAKKAYSVVLYGHKTGRLSPSGFVERADWAQKYNEDATEDDPFVVFGHVMYEEPYLLEHSCGIDTGCFKGGHLSAFRWPEREVVSVKSLEATLPEDVSEIFTIPPHLQEDVPEKQEEPRMEPQPIRSMKLDDLFKDFFEHEAEYLRLIDEDGDLKKREHENGLIIANASPSLFEPEFVHQLFAKGIVYRRDPYEFVSMPLVKMFNHGTRQFSDETTQEILKDPDVVVRYPEKADGTMIQVFEWEGDMYFTTRSVLEGTMSDDEMGEDDTNYVALAREVMTGIKGEDWSLPGGLSYIFELIHPKTRIVTNYGDRQDLVLLSVFDPSIPGYVDNATMRKWARFAGLSSAQEYDMKSVKSFLLEETPEETLERNIALITEHLEAQAENPEGTIVCFEKDGQILHRVKAKTPTYLKSHRLKFQCTYKNVVSMCWNNEDFQEWDGFLEYLRDNGLTEEEVEAFYKEHHDQYRSWVAECEAMYDKVLEVVAEYEAQNPRSDEDDKAFFKGLALLCKSDYPDILGLIMKKVRSELDIYDVMRHHYPYEGFKGELDQWRKDQ